MTPESTRRALPTPRIWRLTPGSLGCADPPAAANYHAVVSEAPLWLTIPLAVLLACYRCRLGGDGQGWVRRVADPQEPDGRAFARGHGQRRGVHVGQPGRGPHCRRGGRGRRGVGRADDLPAAADRGRRCRRVGRARRAPWSCCSWPACSAIGRPGRFRFPPASRRPPGAPGARDARAGVVAAPGSPGPIRPPLPGSGLSRPADPRRDDCAGGTDRRERRCCR